MFDLSGKVALVTGAGRGVGMAIAESLARQGAAVAVNDLHDDRAKRVAELLRGDGLRSVAAPFDVCDYGAAAAAIRLAESELGGIDILVNNAGIPDGMRIARFRETSPEDWREYIELNAYGVLNCARIVIDGMCERGWGRIVTISSGAGQVGIDLGVASYGAGKGAGISFTRHLAAELGSCGVTANTLALGVIEGDYDAGTRERLARGVPVGRLGRPQDVAVAVVYLVSPEAGWMTGQTIGLNGGAVYS